MEPRSALENLKPHEKARWKPVWQELFRPVPACTDLRHCRKPCMNGILHDLHTYSRGVEETNISLATSFVSIAPY